ncbi:PucR family transcriptional regulator [Corynebacterium sp. S7]
MSQNLELRNALQQLSVACGRQLVLLAADFSVMAYSIHERLEDRARLAHVMTHSDLWESSGPSRYETEVRSLDELGNIALIPLVGADLHLLAVLVYPLEEGEGVAAAQSVQQIEEFETVRSLVEIEKNIQDTFSPIVSGLLKDLVSPEEFTREVAVQELYDRKLIALAERYSLVLVGPGSTITSAKDDHRVRLAVASVLRFVNSRSTLQILGGMLGKEKGVLIFPRPVQQDQLNRLLEEPGVAPVRAAIAPMVRISDFHSAYQRAIWSLRASTRLKDEYGTSVTWRQSGMNGFIASIPINELKPEDLPEPIVAILRDRNARRWLDTLQVFVESGGDIQETARKAEIHRSTVYYRLERLNDISGIDITDATLHAEILFALRLIAQFPLSEELQASS